jgi:hypothetical protein
LQLAQLTCTVYKAAVLLKFINSKHCIVRGRAPLLVTNSWCYKQLAGVENPTIVFVASFQLQLEALLAKRPTRAAIGFDRWFKEVKEEGPTV